MPRGPRANPSLKGRSCHAVRVATPLLKEGCRAESVATLGRVVRRQRGNPDKLLAGGGRGQHLGAARLQLARSLGPAIPFDRSLCNQRPNTAAINYGHNGTTPRSRATPVRPAGRGSNAQALACTKIGPVRAARTGKTLRRTGRPGQVLSTRPEFIALDDSI